MKDIRFASNGKRDIHNLEYEYDNSIGRLKSKEVWKHENNKQIVIDYILKCKIGEAKSGGKNKKVGKSTLYRIIGILRLVSEKWLDKDFNSTKKEDWDKFYNDMENDILINEYGKKFKPSTKAKIYKTLKKFLKWKFGNNSFYPEHCSNWAIEEPVTSKAYLTRQEVESLVEGVPNLKTKCLLMILFDGGFRIEELGNLRWVDLVKDDNRGYYVAHVRPETSKTKEKGERKVGLLLASNLIDSYKNSQKSKLKSKFNEEDYLFRADYGSLYQTIKRNGKRILNKNVTPHTFRHSSATYFGNNIDMSYPQFCSRYGWSLRSNNPQRYYHQSDESVVGDKIKQNEIGRFKTDFEIMKLQNEELRKKVDLLEGKIELLILREVKRRKLA